MSAAVASPLRSALGSQPQPARNPAAASLPSSPAPTTDTANIITDQTASSSGDPLYDRLRSEALSASQSEPAISCLLSRTVLDPEVASFNDAVAASIAHRLGSLCGSSPDICPKAVRGIIKDALESEERVLGWTMAEAVREDVMACVDRDPACLTILEPLLFFKGFAALVLHRAARRRWGKSTAVPGEMSRFVSFWLQSQASSAFGVDIHPAATIGKAIMLDHATGIVIGETAVVGDGCSLLHGVTLGGTGKSKGKDRHPKVGKDVLIGAGTSVLGNISIGDGAKIGAGSVVLRPIPHGATAVGAPAKIVGRAKESKPGSENDTSMRDVVMVHFHPHRNKIRRKRTHLRRSKSVGASDEDGIFSEAAERKTVVAIGAKATEEQMPPMPKVPLHSTKTWSGTSSDDMLESSSEEEKVAESIGSSHSHSQSDGSIDASSSSSGDEEKKESSSEEVDTSRKGTCIDSQMCIWRSFGEAEAPEGTLNIYQLRRLLQKEGATEAEIGEVFFSLVEDDPFVTEKSLREKFPEVAKKYTKLDCQCLDRVLGDMCNMASPKAKFKEAVAVAGGRRRSNSIPEDAKLNLDDSMTMSGVRLPTLPTITSQVVLSEVPEVDAAKQ